jgi:hypothetical protein
MLGELGLLPAGPSEPKQGVQPLLGVRDRLILRPAGAPIVPHGELLAHSLDRLSGVGSKRPSNLSGVPQALREHNGQ